jgi:hypothetical protein
MVKQALKRRPGRPTVPVKQVTLYNLKGVPTYKEWLDGLAEHCGLKISDTIGQALMDYAEKRGYRPPPKR